MKLNRTFLIAAAACVLLFGAVMAGSAGSSDPGSADDPLVTRSYVEAQINSRLSGNIDQVAKLLQWQVVDLAPGQRLEADAGTELIVRVGQMAVVDPAGNGIPDVTAGANIIAGQIVALNHHLIIPRTDGRGLIARAKSVVMYRGQIQVK